MFQLVYSIVCAYYLFIYLFMRYLAYIYVCVCVIYDIYCEMNYLPKNKARTHTHYALGKWFVSLKLPSLSCLSTHTRFIQTHTDIYIYTPKHSKRISHLHTRKFPSHSHSHWVLAACWLAWWLLLAWQPVGSVLHSCSTRAGRWTAFTAFLTVLIVELSESRR